ncbi:MULTISPECIES: hypothetical protein [unclassified Mesorhizobium]|uniref:hypothetical protein n=1 Tax=unclassified Mesorhizobium TaxID=325217 RepID=UPI0016730589|nr:MULTISPECIES: hypothetical protein [unclassified Mesorhizobium]
MHKNKDLKRVARIRFDATRFRARSRTGGQRQQKLRSGFGKIVPRQETPAAEIFVLREAFSFVLNALGDFTRTVCCVRSGPCFFV